MTDQRKQTWVSLRVLNTRAGNLNSVMVQLEEGNLIAKNGVRTTYPIISRSKSCGGYMYDRTRPVGEPERRVQRQRLLLRFATYTYQLRNLETTRSASATATMRTTYRAFMYRLRSVELTRSTSVTTITRTIFCSEEFCPDRQPTSHEEQETTACMRARRDELSAHQSTAIASNLAEMGSSYVPSLAAWCAALLPEIAEEEEVGSS